MKIIIMSMNIKFYLRLIVFTLLGLVNAQWAAAQNVTIKATNGSTIAAVKNGGATDTFFGAGGFATWQHEQLSMVLTTSDGTALTPNQQLDNPANNLFTSGNHMQIAKGQVDGANVCYVSLSLPKGYRFTGYNIVFKKSNETKGSGTGEISFDSPVTSCFGETGSDFSSYTTSADVTNGGGTGEISRTEMSEGEMGNVLYFKLINTSEDEGEGRRWSNRQQRWVYDRDPNNRALITLESAEFFFTAEENYSPVTPASIISSPVSAVDIPFSTSKVDYGAVVNRKYTINGIDYWRMSYSSADVKDLEANLTLYEYESTESGNGIDGTSGKVVKYDDGTISSAGDYFKLGKAGEEQVYCIETPTYVTLSNGTKNPVGYRITKAVFDYTTSMPSNGFYISYTDNGTKYYLNTGGRFTTTPVVWEIDNDGFISSDGHYIYWNNNFVSTQTEKPVSTGIFSIADDGSIYMSNYPSYYIRCFPYEGTNYGLITNNNYGSYATKEDVPSANVDAFTLKVYDKTGKTATTIPVSGKGSYELTELNNDAVKFGVQGIGLVRATLTMQALDPYLNSMDVVCLDNDKSLTTPISLSQTFTASDFSVSGGEFYFYLPSSCNNHKVGITFENLNSKYFDETYPGGSASHTSRINFVKSRHYNAFGASNNNIYNNRAIAANDTLESTRINTHGYVRTKVGTVGSTAFKFNNADVVGNSGGTLTEYPFSLEKYAGTPNNGSFGLMEFTVSAVDQHQTKYVFTTDETRYNIAPTTATQHRAYAFYEMTVHVQTQTYDPKVEFKKIYDHTLFRTGQDSVFYGVKVTAYDGNTPPKPGYSSTKDIASRIKAAIKSGKDDFGHTFSDLKYSSQLLYIDLSEMAGVYQMKDETQQTMDDFTAIGAKNCLVFIPAGSSSSSDNVAFKTGGSAYMAAHDIILTDKEPFYSPYDIQIAAANKVEYKRTLTPAYGTDISTATMVLPFNINVTDGLHENNDGSGAFEVYQLDKTNCLSTEEDLNNNVDYMKNSAHFVKVDGTTTEANKPYMIKVTSASGEDKIPFIARINGATIKKTPDDLTGETGTGSISKTNYTFTSNGTFSGATLKQTVTPNIFYFAKNALYNIQSLEANLDLYVLPFRAYYSYTSPSPAKANLLEIVFGANDNPFSETTGITSAESQPDLAVTSGHGTITIASKENNTVNISALNGMQAGRVILKAGETKTVNVPAGLYVVNGVKIVVK